MIKNWKRRIIFIAPQWRASDFKNNWWRVWYKHACDEYGNCSQQLIFALLGGVEVFPFPHFQEDIKLPEPGENDWVDRVYWKEIIGGGVLTNEERARIDQQKVSMPGSSVDRAPAS
jgi:hypothetical protein